MPQGYTTWAAYLDAVLHRRRPRGQFQMEKHVYCIPGGEFLTASARDGIEFGQTAAEWRRRHPLWPHIYTQFCTGAGGEANFQRKNTYDLYQEASF